MTRHTSHATLTPTTPTRRGVWGGARAYDDYSVHPVHPVLLNSLLFVVLELDVEALLDTDLHLDRRQGRGRRLHNLHHEILLLHVPLVVTRDGHADKVPVGKNQKSEDGVCVDGCGWRW